MERRGPTETERQLLHYKLVSIQLWLKPPALRNYCKMKMISPRMAILALFYIMVGAYFYDFDLFKTLLGWLLGGIIVQLVTIAVFGNLIANVMKNKDVQDIVKAVREEMPDFKKLLKEALRYLKQILDNQKNTNHQP